MKKAFTLIELLVVIAIIAILAAILFPVFAQAKLAAKKAVSISNQKQIGLGVLLYTNDYDDLYPHNDGCTLNDSLLSQFNGQPAGTNPNQWCNGEGVSGVGGYAFRDNHYSWQKWIMPYVKSVGLFIHPVIPPIYGTSLVSGSLANGDNESDAFVNQGEFASGYALNIAITGAQNTWPTPSTYGAYRNSFVGGSQTSIPSPAEALLVTEQAFEVVTGGVEYPSNTQAVTYYPVAIREHWAGFFYQQGGSGFCGEQDGVLDSKAVPFSGQIPISYADGHTKSIAAGQFLAQTPSYSQFGIPADTYFCKPFAAYYNSAMTAPPSWTQPWPFWGLQ